MNAKYAFIAIGIIFAIIFTQIFQENEYQQKKDYKITSLLDFDKNLKRCFSFESGGEPEGFNKGLKIVLKDKRTGELLDGETWIESRGGGGNWALNEYYCQEKITSELVSVYAQGYAPVVVALDLPKNKLATVEIYMVKSCSGGPTCFDNLRATRRNGWGGYTRMTEDIFYEDVSRYFGLNKEEYALSCAECNPGRGGYIKARGIYKTNTPFELYYRWGWYSPAGNGFGWSMCFRTNATFLFESMKNRFCRKIASTLTQGPYYPDEVMCTPKDGSYDHTEQVQGQCFAGEYETIVGDEKTLAINQISDAFKQSVSKENVDCIGGT